MRFLPVAAALQRETTALAFAGLARAAQLGLSTFQFGIQLDIESHGTQAPCSGRFTRIAERSPVAGMTIFPGSGTLYTRIY